MNTVPMITALRGALPYLKMFRSQTFVVKCGGEILDTPQQLRSLIEQIGLLHQLGICLVLIHGGGKQATMLEDQLGVESRFVDGRRITSKEAIKTMEMAINGSVRTAILSSFRELGIDAVGISGIDGGLVEAEVKGPVPTSEGLVDFGEVGVVRVVNGKILESLIEDGFVPVVSPLSADSTGRILNINADDVAAAIATKLGAAKLIFVTKPRGILDDLNAPETLHSHLSLAELTELEDRGVIQSGLIPKANAIRSALLNGVDRVHVVSFAYPDSLLTEIFTNEGCGTMIVRDDV